MSTKTDVATRDRAGELEAQTPPLIPPVDVTEDDTGITLLADLPGAVKESLSIDVNGDTLTIEAPLSLGDPPDLQAVYAEIRSGRYRRSFTLSLSTPSFRLASMCWLSSSRRRGRAASKCAL